MINNKTNDEHSLLNQYRHIVDATNIVSKTDPNGIITYANSKFIEISGYSEDELLGSPHNILRNPDSPPSIYKELWSTIKAKKEWHGIITNIRKDGTKYTVEASIFPITNDSGEIIEYIAIRHDISKLIELNEEIKLLHDYDSQQQEFAMTKIETGIVNDFNTDECQTIYIPSDIMSGDFYSLYKRKDGSTFIYLIDGQGHGITPAMTVFAISSVINQVIHHITNLHDLIEEIYQTVKTFLGEVEQLSYTMILISPDSKKLCYFSAGMYPFLIKKADEIMKIKANNTPFMNFSEPPSIKEIDIEGWESLLVYSDGLVEHEYESVKKFSPELLLGNPSLINNAMQIMKKHKFEDDVTLLHLNNLSQLK